MKIRENVPIRELTTMRLGGAARFVVEVFSEEDVREAYAWARDGGELTGEDGVTVQGEGGLPVFILGMGANVIGRDEGFPGVVILDKIRGITFENVGEGGENAGDGLDKSENYGDTLDKGDVLVTAGGGEVWDEVVGEICARGLTGVEALSAIPGTVGAAPVQNIGAYGQEVGQVVERVRAFDTSTGEMVEIPGGEMKFGYRRSIFNREEAGRYFITAVTLRLREGQMAGPYYKSLEKYMEETGERDVSPAGIRRMVTAVRGAKLPDPRVEASAGSFFKNVHLSGEEAEQAAARGVEVWSGGGKHKVNAGWLIEAAGLKGRVLHGMRVSEKAALILINEGASGYGDLDLARREIREAVERKFGYWLEQEPVEMVDPFLEKKSVQPQKNKDVS